MNIKPETHRNARVSAIRESRRDPKKAIRIQKAMQLATAIEDAMNAKGWNRSTFAQKMGVQPSQITRWLSGTQGINTDTLFEIEEVLGCELVLPRQQQKHKVPMVAFYAMPDGIIPNHAELNLPQHFHLLDTIRTANSMDGIFSGNKICIDGFSNQVRISPFKRKGFQWREFEVNGVRKYIQGQELSLMQKKN